MIVQQLCTYGVSDKTSASHLNFRFQDFNSVQKNYLNIITWITDNLQKKSNFSDLFFLIITLKLVLKKRRWL